MQMKESEHTASSKTAWGLPARILGSVFLVVAILAVIGLTRPFWVQLILAACLAIITRQVIAFTQHHFHFSPRLATIVGILFLLLLVLLSIPLATAITTSIDRLAASLAEFVVTLVEEMITLINDTTDLIFGLEATEHTPILGPLIEYL